MLKLLAPLIALLFLLPAAAQEILPLVLPDTPKPNYGVPVPEQVTGLVVDVNIGFNEGVPGVSVTDGYSVVKTDWTGAYKLTPNADAVFVYITRPSGYDVKGPWYQPVSAEVNFTLDMAENEAEYTFINVSDTHVSTDPVSTAGLSAFVREVNGFTPSPRFVINSGDLIDLSKTLSNSPELGQQFFQNYVGIMNNLTMPHYHVAGDHTDSSYRLDEFPRGDHRAGKPQYWEFLGPNFFSFEYGKIHFMSIDSSYHLGKRQLHGREYPTLEIQPMHTAWMKDDMAKRRAGTHVVTASETDLVEQCPGFQEMATEYDVRFQMTGDIHVVSEKHHEVPFRTAGALAGCWWNPKCNQLCPDLRPQGYLIYRVTGDTMEAFYKGLGQRVAITSHRIGAPWSGSVVVAAHLVQPEDGEGLQLSLDGTTWVEMVETSRPFYRAVFSQTVDSTTLPDGLHQLHVRSTLNKETRSQDVVVVNGGTPANLQGDATLTFSTATHAHREANPPSGGVQVLFNGSKVGELIPDAAKDYSFSIPADSLEKANTVHFQFETDRDGMYMSSPTLTVTGKPVHDIRDSAVNAIKRAHWGNEAVRWGGFVVGEGELIETPFIRKQDVFCFVVGAE